MTESPAKWAEKLLIKVVREDFTDEIIGDMAETHAWRKERYGARKAKLLYLLEAFKFLKPSNLKPFYHFSLNTMIFRNYLNNAVRNIFKRKSTSFLNISGLTLGALAFIIISLYSIQILTFDQFFENKEHIFLAFKERITPNGTQATYDTWIPMAARLKAEYPQIEASTSHFEGNAKVLAGSTYFDEAITYTDNAYFQIFDFPIVSGNASEPLYKENAVVLSYEAAQKYFPSQNALGELLQIYLPNSDTTIAYEVTGVLAEYPENISLQPNLITRLSSLPFYDEEANAWDGSFLETFILLQDRKQKVELEALFPDLVESIWDQKTRVNTNFKLLPFEAYYDTFVGDKANARILLIIGIGILLVAAINFMNLSTAQASHRMKEIGVRKVLGAFRNQLRAQFFVEALLIAFVACGLAAILSLLVIPYFNTFFEVSIGFTHFTTLEILAFFLALPVALGLLSGSYPAFYLSSIKTIDAFRKKAGLKGVTGLRNGLVILQFGIALFLISSTILVRDQINYMSTKSMGFEGEEIFVMDASRTAFIDQVEGIDQINAMKNELRNKSYVSSLTTSRSIPTNWTRSFIFVRPDGWEGDPLRMRYTFMDENFFDTYAIPFKYGRNFFPNEGEDQKEVVVLNEAAARAFEFDFSEENAIKIGDRRYPVIGVVEDFNFESLESEVAPTLMFHRSSSHPVHNQISIKMEMSDIANKIEELEALWSSLGATDQFAGSFMDDNVEALYREEKRYLGLITMFSSLAIIIACIGIYGLTLFIIEKRRKEISIRKVLGAKTSIILRLIIQDFARWVAVAFVLSIPLVIYFMADWLNTFHYRIELSAFTFIVAFLIVLLLVLLTVGYESIKASLTNPVNHLKDE